MLDYLHVYIITKVTLGNAERKIVAQVNSQVPGENFTWEFRFEVDISMKFQVPKEYSLRVRILNRA